MRSGIGKNRGAGPAEIDHVRKMKTILAPIDFSPVSEAAIREAVALAHAFSGRLVLLNVVEPMIVETGYGAVETTPAMIEAAERYAASKLPEYRKNMGGIGIPFEWVQLVGPAARTILEQAEKHLADYIVMGSHHHRALYDLLVGSTTHAVVLHAHCPVVIVNAERVQTGAKRNEREAATV
jgi:nucleotide-binding universal stress UspA family protein